MRRAPARRRWRRSPRPTGSTPPMTATPGAGGWTARCRICSRPRSRRSGSRPERRRTAWRSPRSARRMAAILCHRDAHIQVDECGAPEFYTHGAKLLLGDGEGAKLTPETVRALAGSIRDDVHQMQPAALSITNATEYGLVYTPEETAALGALCRERGLGFHLDGARFANAVARLGLRAGRPDLAGGRRRALLRLRQEWRAFGRMPRLLPARAGRGDPLPAQARRPSALQGPLSGRADPRDARGRRVAAQRARRERRRDPAGRGGRRGPADPCRWRRTRFSSG